MPNKADDFNEQREQGEQAHIWLRYATQFTVGERTYTIDIGIPVPPGADAATREQLLREADAGLDQLADYVERRVMQIAQQSGQGQRPSAVPRPTAPAIPTPPPVAAPAPLSLPASPAAAQAQPSATAGATPASPAGRPSTPARPSVSPSAARTTAPVQSAQTAQSSQPAAPVASSRPGIGASMPSSPGLNEGTMSLPEFLKYLKDMGLDARRAMALLKVKSLSDLNLREALKQLQHILMEEGGSSPSTPAIRQQAQAQRQAPAHSSTGPQAPTRSQSAPARSTSGTGEGHSVPGARAAENTADTARPATGSAPSPQATQAEQTRQTNQTAAAPAATANRPARPATPASPAPSAPSAPSPLSSASSPASTVRPASGPAAPPANGAKNLREGQASYPTPIVFDEEDDESELEDLDFDEDEDEEQEASFGAGVGLSAAHRGSVEDIVSRLRESGGATLVSASRLKVLHNVVDGQLKPEQLQALVRGVWGAASEKKLKSDQAEALISWGKQDDFVAEAEMLLAHFEENGDASSNR